jgi:hypothetical protein
MKPTCKLGSASSHIATRCDKTKEFYLGFVALASVRFWILFVHETYQRRSRFLSVRVPIGETCRAEKNRCYFRDSGLARVARVRRHCFQIYDEHDDQDHSMS